MTAETEAPEVRAQKLEGLGIRRKRVEDVRFTQGKGNYVDDFKLPGMLFGDFVRSPGCGAQREQAGEHLRCIGGQGKRRGGMASERKA